MRSVAVWLVGCWLLGWLVADWLAAWLLVGWLLGCWLVGCLAAWLWLAEGGGLVGEGTCLNVFRCISLNMVRHTT